MIAHSDEVTPPINGRFMRIPYLFLAFGALFLTAYPAPATAHPEVSHRIEALEEQLKSSPSSETCSQLVELLLKTKACDRGLSIGESCLQSQPYDPPLSFTTARAAICARKFPRAEELVNSLKVSHGSSLEWGYLNIYLQETRGSQTELLQAITSLIELHPTIDPHVYLRAVTLGRAVHPEQSPQYIRLLEQGIATHPKSLPLRIGLLSIQESTRKHCDAIITIDDIMKEFPTLNQPQWLSRKNKAIEECKTRG